MGLGFPSSCFPSEIYLQVLHMLYAGNVQKVLVKGSWDTKGLVLVKESQLPFSRQSNVKVAYIYKVRLPCPSGVFCGVEVEEVYTGEPCTGCCWVVSRRRVLPPRPLVVPAAKVIGKHTTRQAWQILLGFPPVPPFPKKLIHMIFISCFPNKISMFWILVKICLSSTNLSLPFTFSQWDKSLPPSFFP